ncbi:MAG TPA: DUF3011 domain-containing protein [Thermomonas sp.]|nr:DUF3011 domain-containing protein [Thermomonas sp.]HRA55989.1 DUF3011 domain-containing protein [Thermomonas sp.]
MMRNLLAVAVTVLAASAAPPASAQYYGGDGYRGDSVRCESDDGRYRECPTGGGRAMLERQLSRTACIEGRTWGQGRGGVWVDDGCRADFRVQSRGGGYNGGYNDGYGQTVRCESNDGRSNRCALPGRGRAQLVRQISSSACIEGRTWGSDYGSVWVDDGCRGDFSVMRGNSGWNGGGWGDSGIGGRTFRCESNDNRYNECAANVRAGVQLVRQLSSSPCIQGRSWGYGRNGIWVAQGCRAEFRSY